jgi:hypothetical protein
MDGVIPLIPYFFIPKGRVTGTARKEAGGYVCGAASAAANGIVALLGAINRTLRVSSITLDLTNRCIHPIESTLHLSSSEDAKLLNLPASELRVPDYQ